MRTHFFVFMFAAISATGAQAQTLNVDSLREALSRQSDLQALRSEAFELNKRGGVSSDAMLERGLVLLRVYDLTRDDNDIDQARSMFDRVVKRSPNDANAYYARALARRPGGMATVQSVAEIIKRDAVSMAKRDYKMALSLDPKFASAAINLAQLSLDTRDHDNMEAAAVALRRMAGANIGGIRVATALSQVEEGLGNLEAAAKAAEEASSLVTGDKSGAASASHAHAVALLRQIDQIDAGAKAYFEGVDQLNDESAKTYFNSVSLIATDAEVESWNKADIAGKREWLRRFWSTRAAASGVTVAERMAEHFNRLAAAQEKYRKLGKRGSAPNGALLLAENHEDIPFDDRGIIYVRHGKPAEIVHTSHEDLRPNESWVYHVNGKQQLFNFVVLRDGTDYRLVDDILVALDPTAAGIPTEAAARLLRDRQAYEPRYASMAQKFDNLAHGERLSAFYQDLGSAGQSTTGAGQGDDAMHSLAVSRTSVAFDLRQEALSALKTDSDRPDFTGDLPFYYDLYAFKGTKGLTDITAAAAVPGTSLFSRKLGNKLVYSIQASLIFVDTATSEITRKDSIYNFAADHVLGHNEHLRVAMNMSVPFAKAGLHRIVLRDLGNPGVGQLYGGPSEIKNFSGASLMISDIILAEAVDGKWKRGNAHLGLVPPRQFEEKKPLKIFYELYNVPAQTPYRTEISMTPVEGESGFGRLKKLFGAKGSSINIQFDGVATPDADGTVQELRQITSESKPGKYRVEVRVTNLQNQQSVRTETIFLVGNMRK